MRGSFRSNVASSLVLLVPALLQSPAPALAPRAPALAPTADPATLSISAPAAANLGTGATGAGSISGSLGPVTVTQSSVAGVLDTWTATVSTTPFTTTSGAMSRSLPTSAVRYLGGAFVGAGVILSNCTTSPTAQTLESPRAAYSCGGSISVGTSVVSWTPTVTVAFPPTTVAGIYRATITHSVS